MAVDLTVESFDRAAKALNSRMNIFPSQIIIVNPVAVVRRSVNARSGQGHESEICEQIVSEILVS